MAVTSESILDAMIDRVATQFAPRRIVLFGSHAAGTATDDSDVDLFVITDDLAPPHLQALAIRKSLADFPVACDVIVSDPASFARKRRVVNHIAYFASKYGRVVYEG